MKNIQIMDIDYSGKDILYKKEEDVDLSKISAPWIVPGEGPFYKDSLRVIKGGLDIDNDKFKAVTEVTDLTELTGRGVCLYVELAEDILASKGTVTVIYQQVGKPVISVKTLLQMLEDMVITGKPVDWDTQVTGKPKSVWAAQHSHDIQNPNELIGFGGLVELFTLFTNQQILDSGRAVELLEKIQTDMYNRLDYIQKLKWGAIMSHVRNYNNPHGVIPADVDADKLSNFFLATPQQDAEALRSDLYSTPKGFSRLISEIQPITDNYIIQSELPFGYYGSGIYLPPPITGSFEGLGGDTENSVFNLEGNGWLVGLIRAFDGRVKNLYYLYKTDFLDRDPNRTPWLNTYVQYQHPTIQAAGKSPNLAIDGSDGQVLMLGVQDGPNDPISGSGNWWICASNSTFDPASHTLKPVDMDSIINTLRTLTNDVPRPALFKITKVGDWVYLLATANSFTGDDPANYNQSFGSPINWQTVMFRVPYKDLLDTTKTTITFTQVNVNYDTLWRERRTNKNSFIPQRFLFTNAEKTLVSEMTVKYSLPVNFTYVNRKKAWVIVANPNNPRLARLKMISVIYASYVDPSTGSTRAFGGESCINYDWDVVSNTLTLSSNYSMPTLDMTKGGFLNPTQQQKDYAIGGLWEGFAVGYVNTTGSWVPGYGFIAMRSNQSGTPPFSIKSAQVNRDGNVARDYEYMSYPNSWTSPAGLPNIFEVTIRMRSPFGVAGFPRLYSDLYSLTTGMRSTPIEIFSAENEYGYQQTFYRITEGGTDDNYDYRDALQSSYVPRPIYGRKTNSNFGKVDGLTMDIGYVNRPKRKNAYSRPLGLFSWWRKGIHLRPGAPYEFTATTNSVGTVIDNFMQSDGSLLINLDLDYTLDPLNKLILARPNTAKQLRIPKSFYIDTVMSALGTQANELIDIATDFFIASQPGTGADQPYSFWSVTYHLTSSPNDLRMIVGMFTWEVASTGGDGIRVMRPVGMSYPFKGSGNTAELKPGTTNNIVNTGRAAVGADLSWNFAYGAGLQVRAPHVEILDFESEGSQNFEIAWYSALFMLTPGNAMTPRIIFQRRNNQIVTARAAFGEGQAFSQEYSWVLAANPRWGWLSGVDSKYSGGAMDLMTLWDGQDHITEAIGDKFIMYGATYVEGNWSVFINTDVLVTFNGYAVNATQTNWDLRDLTDVYKNQTFYMYCVMNGSAAFYEITKVLRQHNAGHVLVATITTDDFGIVTIERRQSFSISGFPLTRTRDMGIPVSSGSITEQGTYKFISRSELYDN